MKLEHISEKIDRHNNSTTKIPVLMMLIYLNDNKQTGTRDAIAEIQKTKYFYQSFGLIAQCVLWVRSKFYQCK